MNNFSYASELTTRSFTELKKFVNWNKSKGYTTVIIGGWAVYAYKEGLGSRDIDTIVKNKTTFHKVINEFFKPNRYEPGTIGTQTESLHYTKIIKPRKMEPVEINFEVFDGKSKREDVQGLDLIMKWGWSITYQKEIRLKRERFVLTVPTIELLIVQKIIAALDRAKKMRLARGFYLRILEDKIRKDYYDVASLFKGYDGNRQLLKKFLKESNTIEYLSQFLGGYNLPQHKSVLTENEIKLQTIHDKLIV